MNYPKAASTRSQRWRFGRESEWHVIEVLAFSYPQHEKFHLNVKAIYEDGSQINFKDRQVAIMEAQYEEPIQGDSGHVNFGDRESDRVDIGTESLRGMGLGSVMFRELVLMLRNLQPVPIATFYLSEEDAGDENRERRNHFYERFGITFNFFAEARRGGESVAMYSNKLIAAEPSNHQSWQITKL